MAGQVLAAIAGLGGAIGTTVVAGFGCHDLPGVAGLGRVLCSPKIVALAPALPADSQVVLTGWDLDQRSLLELAREHEICGDSALAWAESKLASLVPRKPFRPRSSTLGRWIVREAAYLEELKEQNQASTIVLVNLCPTEALSRQVGDDAVPWANLGNLKGTEPGVTASRIYFRLAIEACAHFVNFTPNLAETPSLVALAEQRGLCFSGRDGKTGQTFLKTVIAPALRDRNLRVDGWFSTNLLGNADGKSLASTDALATKRASKSACLSEILGYDPGGPDSSCHQVHIHYYPPRGDAKEAWDNIDFTGFLGGKMQLKLNLLARDSILAAPLVMDLVLISAGAAGCGHAGHLASLAYFFKSPLRPPAEHATHAQYALLLDFLGRLRADPGLVDEQHRHATRG